MTTTEATRKSIRTESLDHDIMENLYDEVRLDVMYTTCAVLLQKSSKSVSGSFQHYWTGCFINILENKAIRH